MHSIKRRIINSDVVTRRARVEDGNNLGKLKNVGDLKCQRLGRFARRRYPQTVANRFFDSTITFNRIFLRENTREKSLLVLSARLSIRDISGFISKLQVCARTYISGVRSKFNKDQRSRPISVYCVYCSATSGAYFPK